MQDRNSTTKDISQIFQKAFVAVPHAFPAQYSSGQIPATEEPNVWAWATQSGYKRKSDSKIETLFSVEQDLKFLLPGLKLKGTFSFDRFSSGTVSRGKTPDYYVPATGRDDEGNLIHSPHWFELAKLRCWKVYKTTGTPCSCMICQGERYNRLSYKKETQRIIQKAVG